MTELSIHDTAFTILPEGAVWHKDAQLLVVADLHLEKGSALAARGRGLLPPYDTAATLALLVQVITRVEPRSVLALGDSFHDSRAGERINARDIDALCTLQKGREWIWIAGNHDPSPPDCVSGEWRTDYRLGNIVFRHEPTNGSAPGEISGHLHPVAKIRARGESVRRRCVVTDGIRAVLPAFGAYTGGLNVCDPAFRSIFTPGTMSAFMLGQRGVYRMDESRLVP